MIKEKRIVSNAEMSEFLNSMPVVSYAQNLLRWIDTGKDVTASGVLRLKDVPAAAACVGLAVAASGQAKAKNPVDELPGFDALVPEEQTTNPLDHETVVQVRTMLHVPELMLIWEALEGAELIEISATRVKLGKEVSAFLATTDHDAPSDALTEIQAYVTHFLLRYLAADSHPYEFTAQQIVLPVLSHGLTADPVTVEPPVDKNVDESPNINFQERFRNIVDERMTELESLGVVSVDTHFRVPEPLVECVTVVRDELLLFDVLDESWPAADDGTDLVLTPGQHQPHGTSVLLSSADDERVLQLKISLKHAKPPIWRRILVPASMTLDRLHFVIQTAFGWELEHLHDFALRNGQRITDASLMEDEGDPIEEATVSIGELLPRAKSKLTYTYDFGDNWVHTIVLEKTLDVDPADDPDLPHCTGGRGAAPLENCGGVWGWSELVVGANDPTHESHEFFREWLDLAEGETFDPKSFSQADVNAHLTALR